MQQLEGGEVTEALPTLPSRWTTVRQAMLGSDENFVAERGKSLERYLLEILQRPSMLFVTRRFLCSNVKRNPGKKVEESIAKAFSSTTANVEVSDGRSLMNFDALAGDLLVT